MFKIYNENGKFNIEAILFKNVNVLDSELFNIFGKEFIIALIDNTRYYQRALAVHKFTIIVKTIDDISPPIIERGSYIISWGFDEEGEAKEFFKNLTTKWD